MSRSIVVKKKDGTFYNKATKRKINEKTYTRLKNYFEKNPDSTLYHAYGRRDYDKEIPWEKQPAYLHRLYRRDTQLVKTYDKEGNIVYHAPLAKRTISAKEQKKIKKFDFTIDGVRVSLYRLAANKMTVYHILVLPVDFYIEAPEQIREFGNKLYFIYLPKLFKVIDMLYEKEPLHHTIDLKIRSVHDLYSYSMMTSSGGVNEFYRDESDITADRRDTYKDKFTMCINCENKYEQMLKDYVGIHVRRLECFMRAYKEQGKNLYSEYRLGVMRKL